MKITFLYDEHQQAFRDVLNYIILDDENDIFTRGGFNSKMGDVNCLYEDICDMSELRNDLVRAVRN